MTTDIKLLGSIYSQKLTSQLSCVYVCMCVCMCVCQCAQGVCTFVRYGCERAQLGGTIALRIAMRVAVVPRTSATRLAINAAFTSIFPRGSRIQSL